MNGNMMRPTTDDPVLPPASPLRYAALRRLGFFMAALMFFWSIAPAFARPVPATGGGIAPTGVDQWTISFDNPTTSPIIDYSSFTISSGHQIIIDDANARNGRSLHRLTSGSARIAGGLKAQNTIYLVTPSGNIVFDDGADVRVGGLVASTLDISDTDFLDGTMKFSFIGDDMYRTVAVLDGARIASEGIAYFLGKSVDIKGSVRAGDIFVGAYGGMDAVDGLVLNTAGGAVLTLDLSGLTADGGQLDLTGASIEGTNSSGLFTALAGVDILQTNGVITNMGAIQMQAAGNILVHTLVADARDSASITLEALSGGLTLATNGLIQASSNITIAAPSSIRLNTNSSLAAGHDITLDASGLITMAGSVASTQGSVMALNTNGSIRLSAPVTAADTVELRSPVTFSGDGAIAASNVWIHTEIGLLVHADLPDRITATNAVITATNTVQLTRSFTNVHNFSVTTLKDIEFSGGFKVNGDAAFTAAGDISRASLTVNGLLEMTAGGSLSMLEDNATLLAGSNIVLKSGDFMKLGMVTSLYGNVSATSDGDMTLHRPITAENGGIVLDSGGDLFMHLDGALTASNDVVLNSAGDMTLWAVTSTGGSIAATNTGGNMVISNFLSAVNGGVDLNSGGAMTMASDAPLTTAGDILLNSTGNMTMGALTSLYGGVMATSTAGDMTFSGDITASTNITLGSGGSMTAEAVASLYGGVAATSTAGDMTFNGEITAPGDVTLNSASNMTLATVTSLDGNVAATNTAGTMAISNATAGGTIDLSAWYLDMMAGGLLATSNDITLNSAAGMALWTVEGSNISLKGTNSDASIMLHSNITAAGAIDVYTASELNMQSRSWLSAHDDVTITQSNAAGSVALWAVTSQYGNVSAHVLGSLGLTIAVKAENGSIEMETGDALTMRLGSSLSAAEQVALASGGNMTLQAVTSRYSHITATNTTGNMLVSNNITAGTTITLESAGALTLTNMALTAVDDVLLAGVGDVVLATIISQNGSVDAASSTGEMQLDGHITAGGTLDLTAQTLSMPRVRSLTASNTITLNTVGNMDLLQGAVTSLYGSVAATSSADYAYMRISNITAAAAIDLQSWSFTSHGLLAATNDVTINTLSNMVLASAASSAGDVVLTATSGSVIVSNAITAAGAIDVETTFLQMSGTGSSLAASNDVTLRSSGGILLRSVTGSNVSAEAAGLLRLFGPVTAEHGSIEMEAGGALIMYDDSSLSAAEQVLLSSGSNMTLQAVTSLYSHVTATNTAGDIIVTSNITAGTTLTLDSVGTLVVSNGSLTAGNDILLTSASNMTLRAVTSQYGNVTATNTVGNMTLHSNVAASAGTIDLSTPGNLLFQSGASLDGSNVWLYTAGTLDMTNVAGRVTATNAAFTAGNSLTLGAPMNIANDLSVTSLYGNLTITNSMDIGGNASFTAFSNLTMNPGGSLSAGGDVALASTNAMTLRSITSATGDVTAASGGTMTLYSNITATAGTIDLSTPSNLVLQAAASLSGSNVWLYADGTLNMAAAAGAVTATNAAFTSGDSLTLGAPMNIANDLSVTSLYGNVAISNSMDIGGNASFTAFSNLTMNPGTTLSAGGDVALTSGWNMALHTITSTTGDITATSGGPMQLDNSVTAPDGRIDLSTASYLTMGSSGSLSAAGDIDLASTNGMILRNITSTTGDITVAGGEGGMWLSGSITASAGSMELTTASNLTMHSGSLFAGGDIDLASTNSMTLYGVTSTTGGITAASGGEMRLYSNVTAAAGTIDLSTEDAFWMDAAASLSADGDIDLSSTYSMTLQAVSAATGGVLAVAGGNIGVDNSISAANGTIDLTAGSNLVLQTAASLSGSNVWLYADGTLNMAAAAGSVTATNAAFTAGNNLTLGTPMNIANDLSVTSLYGSVTITNSMDIGGNASFTALGGHLIVTNDGTTVSAARNLSMTTVSNLHMRANTALSAGGDITLNSWMMLLYAVTSTNGDVKATSGSQMTLFSNVTAQAGSIDLDSDGPLWLLFGHSLSANSNITFFSDGLLLLEGAVTSTNGDVKATSGSQMTLYSNVTAQAGNIDLASGGFLDMRSGASLAANGDITLASTSNMELRVITSTNGGIFATNQSGTMTLQSNITAGADASFTALGGALIITNEATVSAAGNLSMTTASNLYMRTNTTLSAGGDITLNAISGMELRAITSTNGDVTATSGGYIDLYNNVTAHAGSIELNSGDMFRMNPGRSLSAASNVIINTASGDTVLRGITATNGGVFVTNQSGTMTLQSNITAGADASFTALGGGLILTNDATVSAAGNLSMSTASNLTMWTYTELSAGGDITLASTNDMMLDSVASTNGDITATSGGGILLSAIVRAQAGNIKLDAIWLSMLTGGLGADGDITLASTNDMYLGRIISTTGDVKATSSAAIVLNNTMTAQAGNIDLQSGYLAMWKGSSLSAAGTLTAEAERNIEMAHTNSVSGGDVGIRSTGGDIILTGTTMTSSTNLALEAAGNITDAALTANGDIFVSAGGGLNAAIDAGGSYFARSGGTETLSTSGTPVDRMTLVFDRTLPDGTPAQMIFTGAHPPPPDPPQPLPDPVEPVPSPPSKPMPAPVPPPWQPEMVLQKDIQRAVGDISQSLAIPFLREGVVDEDHLFFLDATRPHPGPQTGRTIQYLKMQEAQLTQE